MAKDYLSKRALLPPASHVSAHLGGRLNELTAQLTIGLALDLSACRLREGTNGYCDAHYRVVNVNLLQVGCGTLDLEIIALGVVISV